MTGRQSPVAACGPVLVRSVVAVDRRRTGGRSKMNSVCVYARNATLLALSDADVAGCHASGSARILPHCLLLVESAMVVCMLRNLSDLTNRQYT